VRDWARSRRGKGFEVSEAVLQIGLSSWIIQDGNYTDFECGSISRFALEFYSERGLTVDRHDTCLIHTRDAHYQAAGIVRFCAERVWVVEFDGVLAFRAESPPSGISPGKVVSGEIYLGVDPYFYFESLSSLVGIPPLIYEWRLEEIAMETAPFVESADSYGRKLLLRDQSKLRRVSIARTDAWHDDDGSADYVLTCRRTSAPPTRNLSQGI
jgi:hypothetical protein